MTNNTNEAVEKNKGGKLYQIGGWLCLALSWFILGIPLAAVSLILGYMYRKYNETQGNIIMGVAIVFLVLLLIF